MRNDRIFQKFLCLFTVSVAVGTGCVALHHAGVPGLEQYAKPDPAVLEKEKSQREKFAINRDHMALYWLLANRISTGMDKHEVEDVLGEPGEIANEFSGVKSEGIYQSTDNAYRWGPDNKGHSVVLFFRDGRVTNFNPKDYQNP